VQISGGLTAPAFTSVEDGDFCFRTNPSATELSAALAARMEADGVRTAVVLNESDLYGVQFANALGLAAGARGIDTGLPLAIEPGLSSHGPLIHMALAREPDAAVMVSYPEQARTGVRLGTRGPVSDSGPGPADRCQTRGPGARGWPPGCAGAAATSRTAPRATPRSAAS